MKEEDSDNRNSAALATSLASPSLPTGILSAKSAIPFTMSVLISAGARAFEVTPKGAYSVAIA